MKGTSETEDREKEIIAEIRKLAGELGSLSDPNPVQPCGKPLPDWESYDLQVMSGMAHVAAEICEFDAWICAYWTGYLFIACGLDPAEVRLAMRLEDLQNLVSELQEKAEANGDDEED